ncbi:hypothetical protein QBZ16_001155 [Prototheca wickerhamii]|uniref:DUF4200 domain-containing protein n=1 Tax=Prototheca wickerhamii TaxID=3111 RepID=A0AAD9IDY5_PROWI|nr:hypothetical protein QBZ16_001155 [Prototheca wickerhamii]
MADIILQEAALRRREKILEIKDLEFQDTILKFSRFLEESAEKRKRSAAKASAERAAEQAALSRREVVLRQVSAAKDAVRALESQLRDFQRYKAFMQAAAEQSHGLLPTPEALMARHELLQATSTSLARECAEAEQALDGARLERAAAAADGRERCERLHLQLLLVQLACDRAERAAHGLLARTDGLAAQERCGAADGESGSAAFDIKARMSDACAPMALVDGRAASALAAASPADQTVALRQLVADLRSVLDGGPPAPASGKGLALKQDARVKGPSTCVIG